jgi:NAD(P)-dependent dehydrogenase (short-subunit alcohol dehydrogenase family)
MPELSGRIAIVTGGSRGIGRAIARELAMQGASVMISSRDAKSCEQTVGEIRNGRGVAASIALDLREADAPAALVAATVKLFGGIDIVVNNAGATQRGDFLSLTDEQFIDGFALKYYCTVRLTRAAWPQLKMRHGSIVNIIGAGGRTPGAHFAIGGSVNAACLSFTKAVAELGIVDGVQVNAVNPGPVRTDRQIVGLEAAAKKDGITLDEVIARMVKAQKISRIGEPEDIAGLVTFIVSKRGSLFQGALIDMEGGSTKTI